MKEKEKAKKRVKQRASAGVLGKTLTRRSRGLCELCGGREQPFPWELPPFPTEPDPLRTLMACARCRAWLEGGRFRPVEAHFLTAAVWADEPAIRLAAGRLLLTVDDADDPWVRDALDAVDLDPDTAELRARSPG